MPMATDGACDRLSEPFAFCAASRSAIKRVMRSEILRRSTSSRDSPSPPRMPMPPFCRDRCVQNRVNLGRDISTAPIQPAVFLHACVLFEQRYPESGKCDPRSCIQKFFLDSSPAPGVSSSSKTTVSTFSIWQISANSWAFPFPM